MMEIHRPGRLLSAGLLVALLAGCGGSESPGRSASASRSDSLPPATTAAAPADSTARECPAAPGEMAMRMRADGPEYRFRIVPGADPDGDRAVDSIVVRRGCRTVQALAPGESSLLPDETVPRLSRVDVDFDGHGDLRLLAYQGMANSTSEYWRFDPASERFEPLGAFDTFEPDSARRELVTRTRGGHAGLIWSSGRHRYEGGRIITVREEAQDWSDEAEGYVRTVRERRAGRMVETARDTLTREEAERAAEAG
jgi:hypothetical protein